jgi:hypothetical protein
MVNLKTLSPFYPPIGSSALTATQMVSLHLSLHRPRDDGVSHDPTFGPYISTMPHDFESHPINWAVRDYLGLANAAEKTSLASLPPAISSALRQQVQKFMADWKAVCKYLVGGTVLFLGAVDICVVCKPKSDSRVSAQQFTSQGVPLG